MTRDKLKLLANAPLVIELEDLGTEATSRFSDDLEYRYNCLHRGAPSMLYLKVDGHLAVKRSGAGVGDEIEIVKQLTNGAPIFTVRRFSDAHLAVEAPPAPAVRRAAALPPEDGKPVRQPVTMLAPQVQRVAAPVATVHPLEEMMQRCFVVAGRAFWNAYLELKTAGCDYDQPTVEDVRCAGISMFIERQRGTRP